MDRPIESSWQDHQPDPTNAMAASNAMTVADDEFAELLESMATDYNYSFPDGLADGSFESFTPPAELRSQTALNAGHISHQENEGGPTTADALQATAFNEGQHGSYTAMLGGQGKILGGQKNATAENGFPSSTAVPPTPNSASMYPTQADYFQHMKHYANQQPLQRHPQNAFTPGISPELLGTPQPYNLEMTLSGSTTTFSPLTSPAMVPQHKQGPPHTSYPQQVASNGNQRAFQLNRGISQDLDMTFAEQEPPRKSRKKGPTTRSTTSNARSRKAATTPSSKRQSLLNLQAQAKEPQTSLSTPPSATGERRMSLPWAGNDESSPQQFSAPSSISPQPLNERMPPPPKPLTPVATPQVHAAKFASVKESSSLPPATPASMMRLQTSNQNQQPPCADPANPSATTADVDMASPATSALESGMEVLKLPEAAAPPPPLKSSRINKNNHKTPGMPSPSAQNSKGKAVDKTAQSSSTSQSTSESPHSSAVTSPQGPQGMNKPETPTAGPAGKSSAARTTKKRGSNGGNLVSPALRPKISPSIKPILPEGANVDQQTQALLLASRSNYQNILEGSHLPGVSYPTDLSTNLTSKRTSHKIAEQGRRNRINTALQEMQGMLPSKFSAAAARDVPVEEVGDVEEIGGSAVGGCGVGAGMGSGNGSERGAPTPKTPAPNTPSQNGGNAASAAAAAAAAAAGAGGGNSKAATVESAIVYIRHLQRDAKEREEEIERLKMELGALKSGTTEKSDGEADGNTEARETLDAMQANDE